jgi:hypothetical protein
VVAEDAHPPAGRRLRRVTGCTPAAREAGAPTARHVLDRLAPGYPSAMRRFARSAAVAAAMLGLWTLLVARLDRQETLAGVAVAVIAAGVDSTVRRERSPRPRRGIPLSTLLGLPWSVVTGTAVVVTWALGAALGAPRAGALVRRPRQAAGASGRTLEVWAGSLAPDGFVVVDGGAEALEHRLEGT